MAEIRAEIPSIRRNWQESWKTLRATLQELEERGVDPYAAVLSLLQFPRAVDSDSLDVSSLAHLEQRCGTNYVPSDDDRRRIQELRAQFLPKLSRIFAEIDVHEGQLLELHFRSDTIQEILDPYLALVSPMRSIPAEILQEIFTHCLRSKNHPIMHTSEAPLLLGRVCSTWRTISLSTPSLWSSVHVVIPPPQGVCLTESSPITDSPNVSARYEGLRTWFQRSGDCPLSISLFAPDSFDFPKFTQAFVDLIISYHRRCKVLKLVQLPFEYINPLLRLGGGFEMLELLDVVCPGPDLDNAEDVQFPRVPPSLRGLSLNLDHANVIIAGCPWEQITTLCLQCNSGTFFGLDPTQLLALLGQCSKLERCRLAFPLDDVGWAAFPPVPWTSIPTQTSLSHLRTLSLQTDLPKNSRFAAERLLDRLILPALQQLEVSGLAIYRPSGGDISDVPLAISNLISRSGCSLELLCIHNVSGRADHLIECLRRAPSLTNLHLDYGDYYLGDRRPDLTLALPSLIPSPSSPTPPLCPNLLHLRLSDCDTNSADHAVFRTIIESRCQPALPHGISCLRSVDVRLVWQAAFNVYEFEAAIQGSCGVQLSIKAPLPPMNPWRARGYGLPSYHTSDSNFDMDFSEPTLMH
ncbi:hypothetical protein C8R43DRAFT_1057757 [Mycena crocata]|nr:hypothetical protein C8R43DRAFT_1057757 [Mycena crocata]